MASPFNAVLCALMATAFWTFLGFALARHLLPRPLALGAAAVIGWAVHSAAMLPVFFWIGFSALTVIGVGTLCIVIGAHLLFVGVQKRGDGDAASIPLAGFVAAAVLALVPAAAILPKYSAAAVQLSDPIFDHSKIAIIDAMTRLGLPPVNPVFGAFGEPGRLAYYYLWHFSAAELALPLSASGWEADIGLTWFTAFASLSLMMGLAVWLGKRSAAAIWVVALAAACSLWPTLGWIFHTDDLEPYLWAPIGMAGWLFQAAWVPQHLMAASCVVTAMLLLAEYARRPRVSVLLALALIVAAAFESSTYVGGVTFAIGAVAAAPILLVAAGPGRRLRFIAAMAAAAVLVACLAAPFILDQLATVNARGGGSPIIVAPYQVLGEFFPRLKSAWLDLPAYWLVLLPIELPASYLAGVIAVAVALCSAMSRQKKLTLAALTCLAVAGLCTSWLLVSTLGENNDLGLRAIIPAEIILIVGAAMGVTLKRGRVVILVIALAGLVASLPDTAKMVHDNVVGKPKPGGDLFARSPELWAAVRRYAAPNARVANNPLYLGDITPWPVNISWALLADRSSCFAGRELALAFAPLPPARRDAINAQFIRVFDGQGTPQDIDDMAKDYGCDVVVVTAQDNAWNNDPFATSADYRLAENREGRWRIYVKAADVKSPRTN